MINLVSLLVAAALVSQHSGFEANAQIEHSKLNLDNNLQPKVIAPKRTRRLKKFVHIWSLPPAELQRAAGDRTELECVVMGYPPPTVFWARNGERIQDQFDEENEILPPKNGGLCQLVSKLIITSTAPGEDQYTCVATSGKKEETATSVVFTLPTEDDEADLLALQKMFLLTPTITYYYSELFQDMGTAAVLPCRVQSATKSVIFWQDPRNRIIYDSPRRKVLPSGDLYISELIFKEDMGNYTCVAKNMFGKDFVTTFLYPNA